MPGAWSRRKLNLPMVLTFLLRNGDANPSIDANLDCSSRRYIFILSSVLSFIFRISMILYRFSAFFIVALVAVPRSSAFWQSLQHRTSIVRISRSIGQGQNIRLSKVLSYQNSTTSADHGVHVSKAAQRFLREAANRADIEDDCVLTIQGNQYNMTGWAKAHPGKSNAIVRFARASII